MANMMACQNHIPVKGIVLMDRAVVFGRTAGILAVISNPKNRLSGEDHRILRIAAEDMKKILGDMKFASSRGKIDPDFPPTYPTDPFYDLIWYEVHSTYDFIAERRLMEQEIVCVELWQYFRPIYEILESARLGQMFANRALNKALIERAIDFFSYLKSKFWEEGQSRVNAELRREDTD